MKNDHKNRPRDYLCDWCLTIYDYLESLNSDFSFETGWYRSVIVKATRNKDLGLLKGVYENHGDGSSDHFSSE